MSYLLIGVGGVMGSLLRYVVSYLAILIFENNTYIGTLFVNIIGSFALSYLSTRLILKKKIPEVWGLAISTGLIGSFTTFSTLSNELLLLLQQQTYMKAITYFFVSSLGGLAVSYLGFKLGKRSKEEDLVE